MKKFTLINKNRNRINENEGQSQSGMTQSSPELTKKEQPDTNITSTESSIVKFFSKLFESREMAHIYHLQVKGEDGSYAKHVALGSFYEDVIDMIDELIEVYMGQYDVIEGYDIIDTAPTKSVDPIEYFNGIASFIKSEKVKCISQDDTHILNLVDEIQALIYRLLYKLKYNK